MVLATLFVELAGKGFRYFNNPTYLKWQRSVVFKDKNAIFRNAQADVVSQLWVLLLGLNTLLGRCGQQNMVVHNCRVLFIGSALTTVKDCKIQTQKVKV